MRGLLGQRRSNHGIHGVHGRLLPPRWCAVSDERRKGWRPVRARSSAPASTPAYLQFHDATMALDTQIHGARPAASAWRLSRRDSHLHRRDDSGSSSCLAPTPANDGEVGEDPDLEF
jgi:hypothetical protein